MGKRILIVDDEPDLQLIVSTVLTSCGYETCHAADGFDAVEKAQKLKPDLILLDIMLPEMNGYQVCRLLKNDLNTKEIPIIMLTAKVQPSDRFWGLETGADCYMTKPFDHQDLVLKIGELLN